MSEANHSLLACLRTLLVKKLFSLFMILQYFIFIKRQIKEKRSSDRSLASYQFHKCNSNYSSPIKQKIQYQNTRINLFFVYNSILYFQACSFIED
ncbi:hypothetical protein T4B_13640 [Trichinella pseudospiralis]|uniref:Uncharacterized protein n=1 Tax=Trichinella pseudospiralis TaxID=6337 RepID=A0A0V1JAW8_TRIPS|nr:hypothetical protein T4B_13640 [Trichinella pseudospiralis]KRZ46187.1 hypothetical protein T4C_4568 [Trichinella pseudospiralis]